MLPARLLRLAVASALLACLFYRGDAPASRAAEEAQKEYSVNPQVMADRIQKQVAEIRGLPYKKPILAENQSLEDFDLYLDQELRHQLPDKRLKSFGKVVKKLGLYRGPEIQDMLGMAKMVMKSQAAAYYDPKTGTFYVLAGEMPELMLGTIYAHELYHGLQDQYFDLDKYMLSKTSGELNDDEQMARQAVVEGEATYIMTLWMMKKMTGSIPGRDMIGAAVRMQSELDVRSLREMVKSTPMAKELTEGMQDAIDSLDKIPPFIIETLVGAYTKGMAFIFEIQGKGWDKAAEVYANPPASMEQILHPEKWLAGEKPFRCEWPAFEDEPALKGWELLDTNTIGELQWRIIFSEHGMEAVSQGAAAGWDGDGYAVLKKGDRLLLLLATSWDTEADAEEFAGDYRELLKVKYEKNDEPTRVELQGREVFIVEGSDAGSIDRLLSVIKKARKKK